MMESMLCRNVGRFFNGLHSVISRNIELFITTARWRPNRNHERISELIKKIPLLGFKMVNLLTCYNKSFVQHLYPSDLGWECSEWSDGQLREAVVPAAGILYAICTLLTWVGNVQNIWMAIFPFAAQCLNHYATACRVSILCDIKL
jgi:hypothetical protein